MIAASVKKKHFKKMRGAFVRLAHFFFKIVGQGYMHTDFRCL